MLNNKRRYLIQFLPYTIAGSFTYPIGKFLFFSESENKKISIALKNITNELTYIKQSNIFIYKKNNNIEIFDAHCTHMGCILKFNTHTKQFNCPCHQSHFDIYGTRLRGPAKRNLDKINFKIKNKILYVG